MDLKKLTYPLGMVAALLMGVIAQAIFSGWVLRWAFLSLAERITFALLCLAAAMFLFAWLAPPLARPIFGTLPIAFRPVRRWALPLAVASYLGSLLYYALWGDGWLVRCLWLAGIGLYGIAFFGAVRRPAWTRRDGLDILLLVGIGIVAFGLRFWRFTEIPSDVHGDVFSIGLQALRLLEEGGTDWFSTGWADTPMFDYVMIAGSMSLFGQDLLGLNLTALVQGMLVVPALYLLGRQLFSRRVGLWAAALLAISYTHIHFSRTINNGSPLVFVTLLFFFIFRALRTQTIAWFALAGLSLGMGLLSYVSSRAAVIVILLMAAWLLLTQRDLLIRNRSGILVFLLASFIGFGPMLIFALQDVDAFVGRAAVVTITNPSVSEHLMDKYGVATMNGIWLEQVKRVFLTFHLYPDASTQFGFPGPFFDLVTTLFFSLGVAFSLRYGRDIRHFALLAWLLVTLVLGGVLTNDPPWWPHFVILIPAALILASLAIDRTTIALATPLSQLLGQHTETMLVAATCILLLGTGIRNWQKYLTHVQDNAVPAMSIARYVGLLPSDYSVQVVADPMAWERREILFAGRHLQGSTVPATDLMKRPNPIPDQPISFIITPNHAELISRLQDQWEDVTITSHTSANGLLSFTSVTIKPSPYQPDPAIYHPSRSILVRTWIISLLAAILFLAYALLGGWLYFRRHAVVDAR